MDSIRIAHFYEPFYEWIMYIMCIPSGALAAYQETTIYIISVNVYITRPVVKFERYYLPESLTLISRYKRQELPKM